MKSFWRLSLAICAALALFASARPVQAATRTWDGGGATDNWSDDENWDNDTAPGNNDDVVFDALSKSSVVDAGFGGTVQSISIQTLYDGSVFLERSLTVTGNIFLGDNDSSIDANGNDITVGGTLAVNSGFLGAPSGTLTIGNDFTLGSSAFFSDNGGTIHFNGNTEAVLSCGDHTFNLITFDKTGASAFINVGTNCSLPLGNDPTLTFNSSNTNTISGTISGTGDLTFVNTNLATGTSTQFTGFDGGTLTLRSLTAAGTDATQFDNFTDLVVETLTTSTSMVDFSTFDSLTVTGALTIGNAFSAPPSMTLDGTLTLSGSGSIEPNSSTTTIADSTSFLNTTASNSWTFFNLTADLPGKTLTFQDGKRIVIENDLVLTGSSGNLLFLDSTDGGSEWEIDAQDGRTLEYLSVEDSNNVNATEMSGTGLEQGDGENNTNWDFGGAPSPSPTPTPSSSSGGGSSGSSSATDPAKPQNCSDNAPDATPNLFQIDTTPTGAILYFSPISGTNQYYISYGLSAGDQRYGTVVEGDPKGVLAFPVNLLSPNTTYYFRIRGQHGCAPGKWGNEMKVTTTRSGTAKHYKNLVTRVSGTILPRRPASTAVTSPQPSAASIAPPAPSAPAAPQSAAPAASPAPEAKKRCFFFLCW
jgi:hypothetical protein